MNFINESSLGAYQQIHSAIETLYCSNIHSQELKNSISLSHLNRPEHFKILVDLTTSNPSKEVCLASYILLNNFKNLKGLNSDLLIYTLSKIVSHPPSFEDYSIIKVYKKTIEKLCSSKVIGWNPCEILSKNLNDDKLLKPTIHALIGISSGFQYRVDPEQKKWKEDMNQKIVPILVQKMKINFGKDVQILYLGIKFLQRSTIFDLFPTTITELNKIMDIVLMVLNSKQPFAKNKYEIRNTNEFYFFHTKKWIYRLIYNIVKKLNSQGSKKLKHIGFENSESNSPKYNETNKWISAHGKEIVKAIVEDLKVDYPVQVTKQILKCLSKFQSLKSLALVEEYRENLQYNLLIPFMLLTPEEQEKMGKNPFEYIKEKDDLSNYSLLYQSKYLCEEVWKSLTKQKTSKKIKTTKKSEAINFLYQLMTNESPVKIQLSLKLLSKIPEMMTTEIFMEIYEKVLVLLKCQIFALRAAAFGFISTVIPMMLLDKKVTIQLISATYDCLTKDSYVYVRLKAAQAFLKFAEYKQNSEIMKPIIYQCCIICLKISQEFWIEHLITSISPLFKLYQIDLIPLAPEIFKQTERVCLQLLRQQSSQEKQNCDQNFLTDRKFTLETCFDLQKQLINLIPSNQLSMVEDTIFNYTKAILENKQTDDIEVVSLFSLLGRYIQKCNKLNENLWIYFDAIVHAQISLRTNKVYQNAPIPQKPYERIAKMIIDCSIFKSDYFQCFCSYFPFLHHLPSQINTEKLNNLLKYIQKIQIYHQNSQFDSEENYLYILCGSIVQNVSWPSISMRNQFIGYIINFLSKITFQYEKINLLYITTALLAYYPSIILLLHQTNYPVYQKFISVLDIQKKKIYYKKLYIIGCLNFLSMNPSKNIPLPVLQKITKNIIKLMNKKLIESDDEDKSSSICEEYFEDSEEELNLSNKLSDEMEIEQDEELYQIEFYSEFHMIHRSDTLNEKLEFVKTIKKLKEQNLQFYMNLFSDSDVKEIITNIQKQKDIFDDFSDLSFNESAGPL